MDEAIAYEWLELRREFDEEGVVLAAFLCRLPLPTGTAGAKRIAALYRRLAAAWERYAEEVLFARARAAYLENEDPRRRTRYFSRVEISADVVYDEKEILSVLRRVLIKDGGARRLRLYGETFRVKDGLLLPLRAFARMPKGCRDPRGFVVCGERITLFHRDGKTELPLKNSEKEQ